MTDQCKPSAADPKKVPIAEAARTVRNGLANLDLARSKQLDGLTTLRQVKSASQAREQARLAKAGGLAHPEAAALGRKIAANQIVMTQLRRATASSHAALPQANPDSWIVHGHVRTRNLKPVPGVTVALYTKDGAWLRAFGHDCTDGEGHFKLCVSGGAKPKQETGDVESAASLSKNSTLGAGGDSDGTTRETNQVYLRVTDAKQALLGGDHVPLFPRRGAVDYREIILDGSVCAPPPDGNQTPGPGTDGETGTGKKTRFLGNSHNREVHDQQNAKKNCQINEIAIDRRVFFETLEDAIKAGYDCCAYCFGRSKSKR